jgi:hypothetical protein
MGARDTVIEEYTAQLQACMYQYSRAIYRSIKDLIDPYVAPELHLEYRRAVLEQCEQTMERLAKDPLYFAKPDRALFQDIRRYFPITAQAEVAWAVKEGVAAAVAPRRVRGSRASARRSPSATIARRTSTSSAPKSPLNQASAPLRYSSFRSPRTRRIQPSLVPGT